MKKIRRLAVVALVLALLTAAYFAGTLVAATQQSAQMTSSPLLTAAQWEAVHGANILLLDYQPGSTLFLPLVVK